jgi:ABC-type sugar transport system substrate-binding protein
MSGNRVKLHRRNKSSIGRPAKAWLTAATVLAAVGWSMGVRAESPADVVTAAMAPIKKFDFGAPFTPPGGKKVTFITCGSLGIGCVVAANAAKDASAVLGWDMKIVDGKVDPGVWNTAIQQAVSDHADGVLMAAVSPALTQGGLEKAKAARIPVFNIYAPKFPGERQSTAILLVITVKAASSSPIGSPSIRAGKRMC